jgi:hypothetical protein
MPSFVTTGTGVVYAVVFVTAFLGVSAGIGRRLLLLLGVREPSAAVEQILIGTVLGAGALQFVPFTLGALAVLSASSLRIALGLVALVAAPDLWTTLLALRAASKRWSRPAGYVFAWLIALLPGLLVAFLLAVTPAIDGDGLGYHLTVPKRWLLAGDLRYLPTYPYSNTPMGVEMLFMNGLAVAGDSAAKLVHFACGLLAAGLSYVAGKRLGGPTVGAVAATAVLYSPFGVGSLIGWAFLEGAVSAALVAACAAWLIWYQERDRAWLRAAVLLAGVGASFKITAALFPVALGILTLLLLTRELRDKGERAVDAAISIARLLPLLVAPMLPWLLRSWIVTGNPVFPIAAGAIPSRDFSAEIAKKFESYNRYMVWGVNLGPSWTLERRKLVLLGFALGLALVGAFVVSRQRNYVRKSTAGVILGTVLLEILAVGLYKRYWIPIIAVGQLPVLALFAKQLSARWVRNGLVVLSGLASLLCAKQGLSSVDYDLGGLLKTPLGIESQRDFLLSHLPLFPLYERANIEQPRPAGVAVAAYCGAFHLESATFCGDFVQESLRYGSWTAFVADVRRLNITHFIAPVEWADPSSKPVLAAGNTSMIVREREQACVGQLIRENAHLVTRASDQGLYAIDLASLH